MMEVKPYSFNDGKDFVTLNLRGDLDNLNHNGFDLALKTPFENADKHLVINCEHMTSITSKWFKSFNDLQIYLKPSNKKVVLVMVTPMLKSHLKAQGMDSAFRMFPSLREAMTELGLVKQQKFDTEFINPFLTATMHVLNVQANIKVMPGKIQLKQAQDLVHGDVSGIIGIVSAGFNGTVVISFPEATFLKVMSSMLGETITTLERDHLDGAGEITNMIFGQAKIVLNEKGYGVKMALPQVVSGKNHTLTSMTKGPVLIIPFESEAGNFCVEICLSA